MSTSKSEKIRKLTRMPSIFQPFRLSVLPRIGALSNYDVQSSYLRVSSDISPNSNKITIGISESAISQYILNPTPKLLSNISIPSTNVVSACDVSNLADDKEIWCYCVKSGKSYFLNASIKPVDADTVLDTDASEKTEDFKIKMDSKVVGIKIIADYKAIVIVLENGLIQYYDFHLQKLSSLDISYQNVEVVNYFSENGQNFMFVLCEFEKNKVCFKLFELLYHDGKRQTPIQELSTTILENFNLDQSKLCYQSGKLYQLEGSAIKTYALPQCHLVQTTHVPMISDPTSQKVSLASVSTNRILLTVNNHLYLLDLVHSSVLSERTLTHAKTFQLLRSAPLNVSTSLKGSEYATRTLAIGVTTKNGNNPTSALEVINVDVGTGTLKDSLGKSFQSIHDSKTHNLKPLFSDDESDAGDNADSDEVVTFAYEDIFKELSKNNKNINKFDSTFAKRLNIQEEHYTDRERFICDQEFLSKVVRLILDSFDQEYPKALTFLLTHPLFPADCTRGLLERFRNHPRLFKQAIVTCPNLPLDDLLSELFSINNGELCLDISLRILQDYTTDMIKDEVKKLDKVDVHNFVNFMISPKDEELIQNKNTCQLFQLLSLVIDAIGLFALDGALLQRLSDYIDEQVHLAERNARLWNLLDARNKNRGATGSLAGSSRAKEQTLPKYTVDYLEL